jgi:EmrB/QacA subfamily drug resistance transporter
VVAIARRPAAHAVTFAVLALGVAGFTLLQSLVIPILPVVQRQLHTTQATVTWVLTAYLLSASIMTPILGRVGDMVGKERVFVAALSALAVGSLLAALARSIGFMVLARVIQGAGGGVMPVAFGIVRDELPAERVTGAVGTLASLSAVGSGLGLVLAGPLADTLGYHWLFWLPMILTIVAAASAILFVPESSIRAPGRLSWSAATLLSGFLVSLLVPLSEAQVWGWGSKLIIVLLACSLLLGAAWVTTELRAATPLIDMRMMRRNAVWTNNLVALLMGVGMYATFAFMPQFVQTPSAAGYGFGATIARSGLMLLPSSIATFVVGSLTGRLDQFLGGKALVVIGCVISCGAMMMLAFAHAHVWQIYVASALIGVGFGLVFAATSALVVAAVPTEQTSVVAGMNANIRTIGGSIGSALMASIVTSQLAPSGFPSAAGYTMGFAVMASGPLLAAVASLFIASETRIDPRTPAHWQPGRDRRSRQAAAP